MWQEAEAFILWRDCHGEWMQVVTLGGPRSRRHPPGQTMTADAMRSVPLKVSTSVPNPSSEVARFDPGESVLGVSVLEFNQGTMT